jgi:hypothetical protein
MRSLLIAGLLATTAQSAAAAACDTSTPALRGLLATEYAFAERARRSLRLAFLEYTSDDVWTLGPEPKPARALFEARRESADRLTWFPSEAGIAADAQLGFTTGPFEFTAGAAPPEHGHFLTVWRREADCSWRAVFDAGISHAAGDAAGPLAAQGTVAEAPATAAYGGQGAADRVIADFERTAARDGLASGLRTYARTRDFELYVEGRAPLRLDAADQYLAHRAARGQWQEMHRVSATDATLRYTAGRISRGAHRKAYAYLELWQYDPVVSNWGLRILLLAPAPG